jgi:RimK family alpha-L-glutamate ligase
MLKAAADLDISLEVVSPNELTLMLDPLRRVMLRHGEPEDVPDFVIAAFASDPSYGNIALLSQFESMGVLCVNRASVMQTTKDKLLTLQRLSLAGVPVSKTFLHRPGADPSIYERELGFPLVLKVIGGSKGKGVVLVENMDHLDDILSIAHAGDLSEELILQKFVSSSKGRDLRVMIAGGKAVDCARRQAGTPDGFKANVSAGGSIINYPMDDEIIKISNATAKALGLFIGGVDLLFDTDGYVVCEVNSVPGIAIAGMEKAWRINMPRELMSSIAKAVTST